MSDRQALFDALDWPPNLDGDVTTVSVSNYLVLQTAARERLAQLQGRRAALVALVADGTLIPDPDPERPNWYMWTGETS